MYRLDLYIVKKQADVKSCLPEYYGENNSLAIYVEGEHDLCV